MTRVAAAYAKQEPDRKKKNTAGKQEVRREGTEEDGRQSLEVMGIGRNSVGNPCRQTH